MAKRKHKVAQLFSYGTLQHDFIQQHLWGVSKRGVPDILPDHIMLAWNSIVFAQPEPDHEIAGVVFRVSKEQLKATDEYEGSFYERKSVKLKSGGRAYAYIVREPREYTKTR